VVDIPATLASRVRLLGSGRSDKNERLRILPATSGCHPPDARYRTPPGREIGIGHALGGLDVISWRVQPPGPRHALEFVFTSVLERDAGAGHEIDDRSRDKDLARFGGGADALGEVYSDPSQIFSM
jgi:hypothetical protein